MFTGIFICSLGGGVIPGLVQISGAPLSSGKDYHPPPPDEIGRNVPIPPPPAIPTWSQSILCWLTGGRLAFDRNMRSALLKLTESAGYKIHLVHDTVSLPDAAASFTIESHRVYFINKRDGSVVVRDVTQLLQGRNGP